MLGAIARGVFGTANDRIVKRMRKTIEDINALEPTLEALSDAELKARTGWFRERLEGGESLDDILPEAFATVREAAKRTLGQRHYDVQLLGGMVLHQGKIAEMKTGEGKTLVSTLPTYLNAISGKGAHVVTVNDYLASRDAQWMGEIFTFLGLNVGVIVPNIPEEQRRAAYAADITYGTNNEFGFDYLRDNMKFSRKDMVQRAFNFAIVDEVDSILVDEARTPLIISGAAEDSSDLYRAVDALLPGLPEEGYDLDEKARSVSLNDAGMEYMEQALREAGLLEEGELYDSHNVSLLHHSNQALRAHKLFQRDTDYIVKDNKVIIIDEFTGRMMEGRRYSEGLHQALEAKEKVEIKPENQTLASITFQNYFRLYPKLAGMTGTAMTEAEEFAQIYGLEVIEIPTHRPMIRDDRDDEVYRTQDEKVTAILDQIEACSERAQPVLVGTTSIEKSELLAAALQKRGIRHNVLNARYHEQEAMIIAQAGVPGGVTIATNMAGRGTDIQLGGNLEMRLAAEYGEETDETKLAEARKRLEAEIAENAKQVREAGGLYVIGTERHESRRIDNQLRGRSGRQGDPGASTFYLSLEDDLMRIFGSERMDGMLRRLGLKEGEAIVHSWINKAIEKAQQKVEARNYDIRKNLLKYDDVMNDQRKEIYAERIELMEAEDVSETVISMRLETIEAMVEQAIPKNSYAELWDMETLEQRANRVLGLELPVAEWGKEEGIAEREIVDRLSAAADQRMAQKAANIGPSIMRSVEKSILLQLLDQSWKEHLLNLDHLRQAVVLRAYGQKDPLNEYKREAFNLFEAMLEDLRERVTTVLSHVQINVSDPNEATPEREAPRNVQEVHGDEPEMAELAAAGTGDEAQAGAPLPRREVLRPLPTRTNQAAAELDPNDPETWGKVQRNAPCPCGSGKKYKHCHGQL